MSFQIRQLSLADYPYVISVIDQWWGGRQMADMLPRLLMVQLWITRPCSSLKSHKTHESHEPERVPRACLVLYPFKT